LYKSSKGVFYNLLGAGRIYLTYNSIVEDRYGEVGRGPEAALFGADRDDEDGEEESSSDDEESNSDDEESNSDDEDGDEESDSDDEDGDEESDSDDDKVSFDFKWPLMSTHAVSQLLYHSHAWRTSKYYLFHWYPRVLVVSLKYYAPNIAVILLT
jgi:hypothetical protein